MIDLHFWPTPNGFKPLIVLEELGAEYRIVPCNIFRGQQRDWEFLKISPNGRMPAMVDHAPADGEEPVSIFESGAILQYLADKHGALSGETPRNRVEVAQWLHWQIGGLGPMFGQAAHFNTYAPEPVPYAKKRYSGEARRLLAVLDTHLTAREHVAGSFSIADAAIFPWLGGASKIVGLGDVSEFANVSAYMERIGSRPSVIRAMEVGLVVSEGQLMDDEARKHLFGETKK